MLVLGEILMNLIGLQLWSRVARALEKKIEIALKIDIIAEFKVKNQFCSFFFLSFLLFNGSKLYYF